ncbi:MAG: ankyrin repeat domain-containing protein [Pseudomonadota bacterium]|nr:ankyrin repeat domain-containing protein [Pseudomonadota bacterium]
MKMKEVLVGVEGSDSHVNEAQRKRNNALRSAAALGLSEKVKSALASGADIHSSDSEGRTAADFAVKNGHAACLQELLIAGLDIDIYGLKLVVFAVEKFLSIDENNDDLLLALDDCLRLLVNCGATTNEKIEALKQNISSAQYLDANPHLAAFKAVENDEIDDLINAMNNGVNFNAVDEEGNTVAHIAVRLGRSLCLEYILSQGFDIETHGGALIVEAKAQMEQSTEDQELLENHEYNLALLEQFGAVIEPPKSVIKKPGMEILEKLVQSNNALDEIRQQHKQELPDYEQARQEQERQRSYAGQESETEFICQFSPGVFFTAGGFKRPRFGVIDPIIRKWDVRKNTCISDFNASLNTEGIYAPRGLCRINHDLLALSYGIPFVQIINPETQKTIAKLDLTAIPSLSPRMTLSPRLTLGRMSSKKIPVADVVEVPTGRRSRAATLNSPPKVATEMSMIDMCMLSSDKNCFATTFEKTVKLWDIDRSVCTSLLKDDKAKKMLKILSVRDYTLFSLDDAGNAFIWDTRENNSKKASAVFETTSKKHNPCIANLGSQGMIAIGYQGINGEGEDYIRIWDLNTRKLKYVVHDGIPNNVLGSPFCALDDNSLAIATKTVVHHNFPIKGNDNLVPGTLIGIYKPGGYKLRFVDLLTQEAGETSKTLPKVVSMQKVDEHVVALGVSSEKGNTLKLTRTNVREYLCANHKEEHIKVTSVLQKK